MAAWQINLGAPIYPCIAACGLLSKARSRLLPLGRTLLRILGLHRTLASAEHPLMKCDISHLQILAIRPRCILLARPHRHTTLQRRIC